MSGSILFFDVFDPGYLPVIEAVVRQGFLPIMNSTSLTEEARARGLPVCTWQASIPAEIAPHVQREVDRITNGLTEALEDPAVRDTFSSCLGTVLAHSGSAFFGQLFALLANQIAALDIFEAVTRQHDLRLIVLGCDNSHVQRVLIRYARQRGIPSLQLAHSIYSLQRARSAGELDTVYADYVTVFGKRARDCLAGLGNSPERIIVTGAPAWDQLYGPQARIDRREARRRLGLDPERLTVLFCPSYADGSSADYTRVVRELTTVYGAVLESTRRLGPEVQLIVRPHPRELRRENISAEERARLITDHTNWLAGKGVRNVYVLEDHKVECIRAADVVFVHGLSTMIPEVMILDRAVIMMPFSFETRPLYTTRDGIAVTEDAATLPDVIGSLLVEPARRSAMVEAQRAVLSELNSDNDGRASERVAAAIEGLANRSSSRKLWRPQRRNVPALDLLFALHDPLPEMKGGTELYTYDLARALERRGHRVRALYPRYLVAGGDECWLEGGSYQGLPVAEVFTGRDAVRSPRNDSIASVVRRYLIEQRPDLVHVQHLMGLSISFLEVLRDLSIPAVLTANDFWFLCDQLHLVRQQGDPCAGPQTIDDCVECIRSRVGAPAGYQHAGVFDRSYVEERNRINREALQMFELVICPSKFLLEAFRCHGYGARRMVHTSQGANLFTPLDRPARAARPIVLLYLGSICHRKGLDLLIEAFNQIDTTDAELHVHGEIVDRAYFDGAMRAVTAGKVVRYHGGYGPATLPGILAGVDVAVVPSRGESFPFVIREILHAGVPVIAPDLSGVPEIVGHGVNGLLFRSNDVQDLAAKLASVIESPGRIEDWRRGIRPLKSIDEEAQEVEQHYQDVLDQWVDRGRPRYEVSIILAVSDGVERTERCLSALAAGTRGIEYELIIVDDASSDETAQWLGTLGGDVRVVRNTERRGLTKARNQGARIAKGRELVFLSNETIPREGWLGALVEEVEARDDVAVVGSKLLGADGTIRHAGIAFSREELTPYFVYPGCPEELALVNQRREFQAVAGACMLARRERFEELGGFDESYRGDLAAVDFCLRAGEAGWRVAYRPESVLDWPGGESDQQEDEESDEAESLRRRWEQFEIADEDIILGADGCARFSRQEDGRSVSVIESVDDADERARWRCVAEVQSLVRAGDLAAAARMLERVEAWPIDGSVLRWAERMCERAGVPQYGAAFRGRLKELTEVTVKQ